MTRKILIWILMVGTAFLGYAPAALAYRPPNQDVKVETAAFGQKSTNRSKAAVRHLSTLQKGVQHARQQFMSKQRRQVQTGRRMIQPKPQPRVQPRTVFSPRRKHVQAGHTAKKILPKPAAPAPAKPKPRPTFSPRRNHVLKNQHVSSGKTSATKTVVQKKTQPKAYVQSRFRNHSARQPDVRGFGPGSLGKTSSGKIVGTASRSRNIRGFGRRGGGRIFGNRGGGRRGGGRIRPRGGCGCTVNNNGGSNLTAAQLAAINQFVNQNWRLNFIRNRARAQIIAQLSAQMAQLQAGGDPISMHVNHNGQLVITVHSPIPAHIVVTKHGTGIRNVQNVGTHIEFNGHIYNLEEGTRVLQEMQELRESAEALQEGVNAVQETIGDIWENIINGTVTPQSAPPKILD